MSEARVGKIKHKEDRRDRIRARYDAAQTTPSNARHWQAADALSPIASNSEAVRSVLRRRARYEAQNNSIAQGIIETIADETIGTGARLQIRTGTTRSVTDQKVEDSFTAWAKKNKLGPKTRLARKSKICSGEVFMVLGRSGLSQGFELHPKPTVELGIKLVEADQVQTPDILEEHTGQVSGIVFDDYGNPITYHILKQHPGESGAYAVDSSDYDPVPANLVLHYFEAMRPGDARGIPELTPALDLFAYERRLTLSTVEASEHLANIALLLKTNGPADGDAMDDAPEPLDTFDFERGQMMALPDGFDVFQPKAEQPTATYVEFRRALIATIARALNIPLNVALGDSSGFNYASGRLDFQAYHKSIRVERAKIVDTILDPIFEAWFDEAVRVSGLLPEEARTAEYKDKLKTAWFFDGSGHVDPTKEAQGQKIRLENGTTTLAEECAREGRDWRDTLDQQAAEHEYRKKLGLPTAGAVDSDRDDEPDDDELDDQGNTKPGKPEKAKA